MTHVRNKLSWFHPLQCYNMWCLLWSCFSSGFSRRVVPGPIPVPGFWNLAYAVICVKQSRTRLPFGSITSPELSALSEPTLTNAPIVDEAGFWPGWDEPKPLNMNQTLGWVFFPLVHPSLRFQKFLCLSTFFSCSFALSFFFFFSPHRLLLFHCRCCIFFFINCLSFFLLLFLFDFFLLFCCCYRFFFLSVFFNSFVTLVFFFNLFFLSSCFFYCYNLFFIISFSFHFPSPYHIITPVAIACCTIT